MKGRIDDVKRFYKGKYKKVLDFLEKENANKYEWDESCGLWIELWCSLKEKRLKINIGIDDMYHLWIDGERKGNYKSQKELLSRLEKI